MSAVARWIVIAIAVAGVIDPVLSWRVPVPIAVESRMPSPSHPRYEDAIRQRETLRSALTGRVSLDGPDDPQAIVLLAGADVPPLPTVPVFAVKYENRGVRLLRVSGPAVSLPSQVVPISASVRGIGLEGETTRITLSVEGTRVDQVEHRWAPGETEVEVQLPFVPGTTGVHRVRISAEVAGLPAAVADAGIVVHDRSLRVLAYEPRPSWPVTFLRRALEDDPSFTVASLTHSSRGIVTTFGSTPASLADLDAGRHDVVLVGAPDGLTARELDALERFAARRGGQVVLLPDRRVPERVLSRFGLPPLEEVLVDRPLAMSGDARLHASELLLPASDGPAVDSLATVRHGDALRSGILAVPLGDGWIVLSGLLDSWRYRDRDEGAHDDFWRGVLTDAALAAPPPLAARVQPPLARPGDDVTVHAEWRRTELLRDGDSVVAPPVEAALVRSDGTRHMVRLWPSVRPGSYEGSFPAPDAGRYLVSVSGAHTTADAVLRVADDVVHPARELAAPTAFAASLSGGAVVEEVSTIVSMLEQLRAEPGEADLRPMRSGWWIVPFTGLLCVEWAARRKRGLR